MVKINKSQGQTLSGSPSSQFTDFSPKSVVAERAPTTLDTGYNIGQEWIHEGVGAYILINVAGGVATWEATGGGVTALATLTGDGATIATPVASNITIAGATTDGLTFTGAAGTLTPSIAQSTTAQRGTLETATDAEAAAMTSTTVALTPSNLPFVLPSAFIVGPPGSGAPYTTIQSAITAAEATGISQAILVRPGSYIENLVFSTGTITIVGLAADGRSGTSGNEAYVHISGMHTPPSSGHLSFSNCFLVGQFDVIETSSAGTTSITFQNCNFNITNGYVFNLPNWTGLLRIINCTDQSSGNGIANATGGSTISVLYSQIGVGTSNTMNTQGIVTIQDCIVGCPINFQTGSIFSLSGNTHSATITTSNNSFGIIQGCYLITIGTPVYTHSTSGAVSLVNSVISTNNNPAISGGGVAGILTSSGLTFTNNSSYSNTITQATAILRGGNFLSQFVVGTAPDALYQTIQSALDAANTATGLQIVYVKPGSYTENLTLYDNVQLIGLSEKDNLVNYINIVGQHTPPTSGECIISNINLTGDPNVFSSNAAGAATLSLVNCIISVTNGYTFNLPNWNGVFYNERCAVTSGDNGEINNTAGTFVQYINTDFGNGTANSATISGNYEFTNVQFDCPVELTSGSSGDFRGGCTFLNTLTLSDNSLAAIYNSTFRTSAAAAIEHNSGDLLTLSDVGIDSSVDPCIGGAAGADIRVGSITFWDNQNIQDDFTFSDDAEFDVYNIRIRGNQRVGRTAVSSTPYVATNAEYFLSVDCSGGAITVQLPNAPPTNAVFYVKDRTGSAATNNISVTTPGGTVTFDGSTTYTMNQNHACFGFLFNGTTYEVI